MSKKSSAFTLINLCSQKNQRSNYGRCNLHFGFTLIELLVVIVIVGILATIGVAQFNGYFEKARLAKGQAFASQIRNKYLLDAVVYWNFDGINGTTIYDSSGKGNHGTMTVANGLNITENGAIGKALDFPNPNNITAYTSVTLNETFESDDPVTISFFVRPHGQCDGGSNCIYAQLFNAHWTNAFAVAKAYNQDRLETMSNKGGNDPTNPSIYNFKPGRWYHVAVSWQSGNGKLFLDGNLVQTFTYTAGVDKVNPTFVVGSNSINHPAYAMIDEVMVIKAFLEE